MLLVLVTGTRTEERQGIVSQALADLRPDFCVLGCCPTGVDAEADRWVQASGVDYNTCKALWKARGKSAGMKRNTVMVATAVAHIQTYGFEGVCQAVPGAQSVGTYDCAKVAEATGLFRMEWR